MTKEQALTPVQQKAVTVRETLEKASGKLQAFLPEHMSIKKFLSVCYSVVQQNPKLLDCTLVSIMRAVAQSASLGLYPDGNLGHAWILPYKDEAVLVPGYRGLVQLMHNSGMVRSVHAHIVHEKDDFSYSLGLDISVHHIPFQGKNKGKRIAVYSVIEMKNGGKNFALLEEHEIEIIKAQSPSAKASFSPWKNPHHEGEMWKKSALRRAAKLAPLTPEIQAVAMAEEYRDAGVPDAGMIIDVDMTGMLPEESETETRRQTTKEGLDRLAGSQSK